MKTSILIVSLLLVCHPLFAQQKIQLKTHSTVSGTSAGKLKLYRPADSSSLKPDEFAGFDYTSYLQQQEDRQQAAMSEEFKNRLIAIDSVIAGSQGRNLTDPELNFSLTFRANGEADTFAISLWDNSRFRESENFDRLVSELSLISIHYALTHSIYVHREIKRVSAMQIDYIQREFNSMQSESGSGGTSSYAVALLAYIHKMLTENRTRLGVTNLSMYENSFEPSALSLDEKITRREKFIRYVYSKITS